MKSRRSRAWLLACMAVGGCATASHDIAPPASPLQLREAQSRAYSTGDPSLLMKAVLATLQDEGFVIRTADAELGVVTASKETVRVGSAASRLLRNYMVLTTWGLASLLPHPNSAALVEATANVTPFGSETRLRISFQLKVTGSGGNLKESRPLTDTALYQEFLAKVDKALFLLKENL